MVAEDCILREAPLVCSQAHQNLDILGKRYKRLQILMSFGLYKSNNMARKFEISDPNETNDKKLESAESRKLDRVQSTESLSYSEFQEKNEPPADLMQSFVEHHSRNTRAY